MKKLSIVISLLLLLSLLSAGVLINLAPDSIPVHYNGAGEADRFGSRFELLIFPALALAQSGLFLLVLRYQRKRGAPLSEQMVLLGVEIFSLLLFLGMELFFGIAAIRYDREPLRLDSPTVTRFALMAAGMGLVLLGNVMPKVSRNALFGLRTKWSMANDRVWQKSQRFGGFSAVICGLVMIVLAALLPGDWVLIAAACCFVLWLVGCIFASYRYWKLDKTQA